MYKNEIAEEIETISLYIIRIKTAGYIQKQLLVRAEK